MDAHQSNMIEQFYHEYLRISAGDDAKKFKDAFIQKLTENTLYRFVPFTDDLVLNERKLHALEDLQLWGSYYKFFEDTHDCIFNYNPYTVSKLSGDSVNHIVKTMQIMRELYNICCFTFEKSNYMWENYSNHYNGFCIELSIVNGDGFYPVIYRSQSDVDFSKVIADSIKATARRDLSHISIRTITILPYVLKNIKYCHEKEIRIMVSPYDDKEGFLGGRVFANKKDLMRYSGEPFSIATAGLSIRRIYIGCNCSRNNTNRLSQFSISNSFPYEHISA